jgi:hypothetical protein
LNALHYANIIKGVDEGDDLNKFKPEDNITRAEFAVIMSNLLQIDTVQYAGVVLPFEDAQDVPAWALNHVKAMYTLGVVNGKNGSSEGKYIFDAYAYITRAEAMAIMGRIIRKSYYTRENSFSDKADIPQFARNYVDILTKLDVVGGYPDGTIRPNDKIKRSEAAKMAYELFGKFSTK